MRQGRPMPCGCKACFFCRNGWTNGIDHKAVTQPPPARQVPVRCTGRRSEIRHSPQSCIVCYTIQSQRYTGDLKGQERYNYIRSLCHGTRLGCSTCDIVVCDFHWPYEFTHNRADYGLLGHR
jgi:hypothetical protein